MLDNIQDQTTETYLDHLLDVVGVAAHGLLHNHVLCVCIC